MNFSVGEFTFWRPIQYQYKTSFSIFKGNIILCPPNLEKIENIPYAI